MCAVVLPFFFTCYLKSFVTLHVQSFLDENFNIPFNSFNIKAFQVENLILGCFRSSMLFNLYSPIATLWRTQ